MFALFKNKNLENNNELENNSYTSIEEVTGHNELYFSPDSNKQKIMDYFLSRKKQIPNYYLFLYNTANNILYHKKQRKEVYYDDTKWINNNTEIAQEVIYFQVAILSQQAIYEKEWDNNKKALFELTEFEKYNFLIDNTYDNYNEDFAADPEIDKKIQKKERQLAIILINIIYDYKDQHSQHDLNKHIHQIFTSSFLGLPTSENKNNNPHIFKNEVTDNKTKIIDFFLQKKEIPEPYLFLYNEAEIILRNKCKELSNSESIVNNNDIISQDLMYFQAAILSQNTINEEEWNNNKQALFELSEFQQYNFLNIHETHNNDEHVQAYIDIEKGNRQIQTKERQLAITLVNIAYDYKDKHYKSD